MSSYLHYAPTSFDEIVLPPLLKSQLLEMRKRNRVENMLFHGRPGLGKSLVAQHLGSNITMIRCDGDGSPTEMLNLAYSVARSRNLFDNTRRIVVLDEIDRWDKRLQEKARALIEETGASTTFIATTNHLKEVIDGLKSRMIPVCFDVDLASLTMKTLWRRRLTKIFKMENCSKVDPDRLNSAMRHFPDGRLMITSVITGLV